MLVLAKMVEPYQLLVMMVVGLMGGCDSQSVHCSNALADVGIDQKTFKNAVGHGFHSITVRDIRYYFEPSFPESNTVPTVNPIFDARFPVLPFAPLGAEAATPGMRILDEVMSKDDGSDNYLIQGLSRMEKIAHGMHMLEVWQATSQEYQKVRSNPPNGAVCSCITDDRANGLFDHLETISTVLKNWSNATALNQLYGTQGSSRDFRRVQKKFHNYDFGYRTNYPNGLSFLSKRSVDQDDSVRKPGHLNYRDYGLKDDSSRKPGHLNYSYDKFENNEGQTSGGSDRKKPGHLNYSDYGLKGTGKKSAGVEDFNLPYNRYTDYPFRYDQAGNGVQEERLTKYGYNYDQEREDGNGGMEMEKMPTLQDQESWAKWKVMLEESKMKQDENRQLAIYIYCKARSN